MSVTFIKQTFFKIFYIFINIKNLFSNAKIEDLEYYKKFFKFIRKFKRNYFFEIDKKKIFYDPLLSGIGIRIFFDGSFENNELNICSKYLKEDNIIFDVGANIGIHSIFFSSIANKGQVYSFEPSRYTFNLLLKNIQNISNITPINIGLSNNNSINDFYETEDNALAGLKDTKRSKIRNISKIVCMTGDSFCKILNLKKLDFLKIDVEGFEQQVIEGLDITIKKFKPTIFCEIYKGINSNPAPSATINNIINLGYEVFIVKDTELQKFEEHNDNFSNYFFFPKN